MKSILFKTISMSDLVFFNDSDKRIISIFNQFKVLHGTHVDLSLLGIKPDFVRRSRRNSNLHFACSQLYSMPIPSFKRQVILRELNLQYLTHGLTTLVKTKSVLVIPNGKIGKTKKLILHLFTQGKTEKLLMTLKNIKVVISVL